MPELLTVDELAPRVRVAPRTLWRLLRTGCGPKVTRLGGRVFISEEDARRWIEERRGDYASQRATAG